MCCAKKREGKGEAQGIAKLWPSFAIPYPRFFLRNQEGRDRIPPPPAPSLLAALTELTLPQLVPRFPKSVTVVSAKHVLTGPSADAWAPLRPIRGGSAKWLSHDGIYP